MTTELPAEAIEAAAKALWASRTNMDATGWDLVSTGSKDSHHAFAIATLTAAAPFIRAQALEDAAQELNRAEYKKPSDPDRERYQSTLDIRRGGTTEWLNARAKQERSAG